MRAMAALLALAVIARGEDYQCGSDAGCKAQIAEDGELREETFRKGDMVSTDAEWIVSTDDGWVKVKTNGGGRGGSRPRGGPKLGLTIGEVSFWVAHEAIPTDTYAFKPPTLHGTFLRPVVSLAAQPPSVSLIGL